ncbi:hypothetical protein CDAR_211131 [Caerostris darwini]|uniref:Uncharacterized protein n=1 Tax=Caerostris darwini TaxID=1538125 RepID=A0AAV4PZ41_9ARAC|nr:hypothetical protein CDAR_211131 [Caerostris darwini]
MATCLVSWSVPSTYVLLNFRTTTYHLLRIQDAFYYYFSSGSSSVRRDNNPNRDVKSDNNSLVLFQGLFFSGSFPVNVSHLLQNQNGRNKTDNRHTDLCHLFEENSIL